MYYSREHLHNTPGAAIVASSNTRVDKRPMSGLAKKENNKTLYRYVAVADLLLFILAVFISTIGMVVRRERYRKCSYQDEPCPVSTVCEYI